MDVDFSNPPAEGTQLAPLNVLAVLSEARAEHGLRSADYLRYRQYCTKRTHRLRVLAGLTHADEQHQPKSKVVKPDASLSLSRKKKKQPSRAQQSVAAAQLGGNTFKSVSVTTADIHDHTILLLFLFEAERHWAHAQTLKAQQIQGHSVPPKQIAARAKRAVQWAAKLQSAIQALGQAQAINARSQLEVGAYAVLVRASDSFDAERWQDAVGQYGVVRRTLTLLAQHASSAKDEAYAHSFLDQAEPGMRYAAYQLEIDEADLDVVEAAVADEENTASLLPNYDALAAQVESAVTQTERAPTEVKFRGRTISIRNPELVVAIQTLDRERKALRVALDQESEDQAAAKAQAKAKTSQAPIQRHTHAERNARRKAAGARRFRGGATTAARTQLDPFDRALAAAGDAEMLAFQLVQDEQAALTRSHSSRYAAATAPLTQVHEYLSFVLGLLRVQRNAHLVERVEQNARLRQKRAEALMGPKLLRAQQGQRTRSNKSSRTPRPASVRPHVRKVPRRTKTAQRGPLKRSEKKKLGQRPPHQRRPARSGTKKVLTQRANERVARLRAVAHERAVRRRSRALPGITRLLEGIETSLSLSLSLELVEADPDLSSLLDAKLFLCRANLTAHLAEAYAASKAEAQAIVLLDYSIRFVKQTGDALAIAHGVDEENALLPPLVQQPLLDARLKQLEQTKRTYQVALARHRSLVEPETHSTGALTDTLSGEVLRATAARYVNFDPVLLAAASDLPEDVLAEAELGDEPQPFESVQPVSQPVQRTQPTSTTTTKSTTTKPESTTKVDASPVSSAQELEEEEVFTEAPEAEDSGEEFAEAHEAPTSPVVRPQPQPQKGWLSSLWGR